MVWFISLKTLPLFEHWLAYLLMHFRLPGFLIAQHVLFQLLEHSLTPLLVVQLEPPCQNLWLLGAIAVHGVKVLKDAAAPQHEGRGESQGMRGRIQHLQ